MVDLELMICGTFLLICTLHPCHQPSIRPVKSFFTYMTLTWPLEGHSRSRPMTPLNFPDYSVQLYPTDLSSSLIRCTDSEIIMIVFVSWPRFIPFRAVQGQCSWLILNPRMLQNIFGDRWQCGTIIRSPFLAEPIKTVINAFSINK